MANLASEVQELSGLISEVLAARGATDTPLSIEINFNADKSLCIASGSDQPLAESIASAADYSLGLNNYEVKEGTGLKLEIFMRAEDKAKFDKFKFLLATSLAGVLHYSNAPSA